MRKLISTTLTILLYTSSLILHAQNKVPPSNSNRQNWKPRQVVQYVVNVAKTGNYDGFEFIADPLGESDGDTKNLVSISTKEKKNPRRF